ncbi:helix-turn-helix domain-containing protein (plasmid) [Haloferax sp. S1W]|uniref:helix-turn-helix domain-containing protein n=1 Tax=Haloferax sp. S1W TaxID=3377110 RepID=UPI0037CC4D91
MRYLTVRLHATEGGAFHPLGKQLADEPSIQREAIHHVELLANGTVLTLAEASGDRERYEKLMATVPSVRDYSVSGEQRWIAMSQFEARDQVQQLLEFRRESNLVIKMPIRINVDGSLRITFLGAESAFQELYEDMNQSTGLDADIVGTGTYDPDTASSLRVLTTRQQEILQAAVEEGYYNNPREATHDELADVVGIAPTTIGNHLREIESRVFETLVR